MSHPVSATHRDVTEIRSKDQEGFERLEAGAHYTITGKLGEGGTGVEYEGRTAIWTAPSHSSSFLATLVQASSDHGCSPPVPPTLCHVQSHSPATLRPGHMVNDLRRVGFYR